MLINCPECGQTVSDKAKVCVHCGFELTPVQADEKTVEAQTQVAQEKMAQAQIETDGIVVPAEPPAQTVQTAPQIAVQPTPQPAPKPAAEQKKTDFTKLMGLKQSWAKQDKTLNIVYLVIRILTALAILPPTIFIVIEMVYGGMGMTSLNTLMYVFAFVQAPVAFINLSYYIVTWIMEKSQLKQLNTVFGSRELADAYLKETKIYMSEIDTYVKGKKVADESAFYLKLAYFMLGMTDVTEPGKRTKGKVALIIIEALKATFMVTFMFINPYILATTSADDFMQRFLIWFIVDMAFSVVAMFAGKIDGSRQRCASWARSLQMKYAQKPQQAATTYVQQ